MMARAPVQHLHVDVAAHALREPFEEIVNQLALQIADALDVQRQVDDRVRASAEIDGRDGERFVHRHDEVAGAVDAAARAERLRDGLAQRDAEIFDRVMLIDVEIAGGAHLEIERAVARHQLEHVIEKADAGTDVVAALAFDAEADANLRLARFSVDYGTAHKPSSASTASLRVANDARRDADAAGAARIARAIAHQNAALGEGPNDFGRLARSRDVDQHEIAGALPVGKPEPLARGVEEIARLRHLRAIPRRGARDRAAPRAIRRRQRR